MSELDIDSTVEFVRGTLPILFEAAHNEKAEKCTSNEGFFFFGGFSSKPTEFIFLPDEKKALHDLANYVRNQIDKMGEDYMNEHFLDESIISSSVDGLYQSVFGLVFGSGQNSLNNSNGFHIWSTQNHAQNDLQNDESQTPSNKTIEPNTQTNKILHGMLHICDKNSKTSKPGRRFPEEIKSFCTYVRLLAGPLAYSTLHRNLELAIPSVSTTNVFARNTGSVCCEGKLRVNELLMYLKERDLPLVVALSEDATRIDGRIQYDSRSNQLLGFVTPVNRATGMPITNSYQARNFTEISKHFSSGNIPAHYVNVLMAQPLGKYPPFCLLIYASDSKFLAEDVNNRWTFISDALAKVDIKILCISSDSDPRYNSAMRNRLSFGLQSHIFDSCKTQSSKNSNDENNNWFGSGINEAFEGPFDFQDTNHVATKLRNLMLKTGKYRLSLPFGKYFIQIQHLQFLIKHFNKSQHQLTKSTLNPVDRQNYSSVLRMISDKVIQLLEKNVKNSQGTVAFLRLIRNVIEAFSNQEFSPLERIDKIWYSIFIVRIWRDFVKSKRGYTLKDNFLTQNCLTCIEINGHSLVLVLLYLEREAMTDNFVPWLFNSQACEEFFRSLRSFTSTYSTKANFSIKEILNRISKIQLLNDIINNNKIFEFPRVTRTHNFVGHSIHKMPTKSEIFAQIKKSEQNAKKFAIQVGMLDKNENIRHFPCPIQQIKRKANNPKRVICKTTLHYIPIKKIDLKNFAHKFIGQAVPETSPYVEMRKGSERYIVKKTSLCWSLRPDPEKLSSDR